MIFKIFSIVYKMLSDAMNNPKFAAFISLLLGFGLASLFKTACVGGECVVIKGPSITEVSKNTYKIDDRCYTYKPEATTCDITNA